jgi:hypothetical protein
MKKYSLTATVPIQNKNEHLLFFIEDCFTHCVESRWGSSEILENENFLTLSCKWSYDNSELAEEDYACLSQKVSEMKLANIVSSSSRVSLNVKETNVVNHS